MGQEGPKKHARGLHDGPRAFQDTQDAPKTAQQEAPISFKEASQEGSKRPTSLMVIVVFIVFRVVALSGFRRPTTDREAPKSASRQPQRLPRRPKSAPKRPGGTQDGHREAEEGPKRRNTN